MPQWDVYVSSVDRCFALNSKLPQRAQTKVNQIFICKHRLLYVIFSLVGWPFSHEYQQDVDSA